MADELKTEDLLAAYLSHDLQPDECALVERRLREDAEFQALAQELNDIMHLLNKGNLAARAAAPQLNEQLTQRLRTCLPEAIFNPASSTQVVLPVVSGREKPVVRLYMAPPSVWRRPRTWLAVAAAFLFVAGGLALALRLLKTNNGAGTLAEVTDSNPLPNTDTPWPPEEPQAREVPAIAPPMLDNPNKALPYQPERVGRAEEKAATPPTPIIHPAPPKQFVPELPSSIPELPPEVKTVERSRSPAVSLPGTVIILPGVTPPSLPVQPSTPTPAVQPTPVTPTPSAPAPAPAPVQPVVPLTNVAVVGAKLGNVQASGVDVVMVRDRLLSGTEISTGQGGKVALVFPGGGHLVVNINSDLIFTINDKTTSVTLRAGEICWHSNSGSLFVTAGGIQVSNAKGVDVKLTQNQMIVSVLTKTATVGSKDKQVVVAADFQAIANLNTNAMPTQDPYSGDPIGWSRVLLVPGDITVAPNSVNANNKKHH